MAISKISSGDAAAASGTLGTFSAGDLCVVFAFRDGVATAPSLPAGWTNLRNNVGTLCASRMGYRYLQAGDTTTGTWTNATEVVWIVLRGMDTLGPDADLSLHSFINSGASATPTWPAYTTFDKTGTGWLLLFGGHRSATDMSTVALGGATNESPATGAVALHDVQGVSGDWSSTSKTVNANSGWTTMGVEVFVGGPAHVSQALVEAVVTPDTQKARASQALAEVLVFPESRARTSQALVEVVVAPSQPLRVSQALVEVVHRLTRETIDVRVID